MGNSPWEPPVDPWADDPGAASQATPVRPDRIDREAEPTTIRRRRNLPSSPPSAQVFAGRPTDRFVAPVEEGPAQKRPVPYRKLAIGILALVIVAIAIGAVYVRYFYRPGVDGGTVVPPDPSTSQVKVERPDEVVRRYLTALSTGDVATALQFGPVNGQGSTALLTEQAYRESLRTHPISNIQVPNIETNTSEVRASYRLGDQDVSSVFRMRRTDDGNWQLAHTTVTVRFDAVNSSNLPLIINGVEVPGANPLFELLPGYYSVATGLPFVTYPQTNAVLLSNLEYDGTAVRTLNPTLTDDGAEALMTMAQQSLSSCLATKELAPANCPNRVTALQPVNADTITWTLVGDPLGTARPALNSSDLSRGEVSMSLQFIPDWVYADGSTPGRRATEPISANISASLDVASAAELRPLWQT